jgi:NAD-dependent deacetylase
MYFELKEIIHNSNNIVFFGGAGVSTESGIPDFRSEQGIYRTKYQYGYSPEILLSHSFFLKHPDVFYDFYKTTMIYEDSKPNTAHMALAELERLGKLTSVITQNIDGLHQKAGNNNVIELHGSCQRNYCLQCNTFYGLKEILHTKGIPHCHCGGIIKPDVVLYEEPLNDKVISSAISYIQNADLLIVGGTSLSVYPAAGLIKYYNGNKLVLINKDSTPYDTHADYLIQDSIGNVFSHIIS